MKVKNSPFVGKMNRAKRQKKIPKHLNEYVLRTKEHSKHSDQAESNMECSDEGDENITFIPPKPKKLHSQGQEINQGHSGFKGDFLVKN